MNQMNNQQEELKQECECTDECLGYLTKECKRIEEPKQEKERGITITNVGKQETLEEAAVIYAHRSFIWPLNKQGEKQSIPPGQLVPSGYAKHQKVAIKHFTNGAKWQQERSYSEEEVFVLLNAFDKHTLKLQSLKLGNSFDVKEWFEQFKKK